MLTHAQTYWRIGVIAPTLLYRQWPSSSPYYGCSLLFVVTVYSCVILFSLPNEVSGSLFADSRLSQRRNPLRNTTATQTGHTQTDIAIRIDCTRRPRILAKLFKRFPFRLETRLRDWLSASYFTEFKRLNDAFYLIVFRYRWYLRV